MAKWYGKIGFAANVETAPGVWTERITARPYYGDVTKNMSKNQPGGEVNDNLAVSNQISIVADPFARENFHAIRYAAYMGANWKVTSVEVLYPRLILSIGGVYNGNGGPQSDPSAPSGAP